MSGRTKYHITYKEDKWNVRREGTDRLAKTFDNKSDAVDFGRDIAGKRDKGQLIIHRKDGVIQTEHTYKKDPYSLKG